MKTRSLFIACFATAALASPVLAGDACTYNGVTYANGAAVCQSGSQYRCGDGEWQSMATKCKGDGGDPTCEYQGTAFSPGSTSCQAGTQYRCSDGTWTSLSVACGGSAPLAGDAPPVPPRTCMLDGTTVASASTVCKQGVMFLCNDGDWRNLGTPCR